MPLSSTVHDLPVGRPVSLNVIDWVTGPKVIDRVAPAPSIGNDPDGASNFLAVVPIE